MAISEVQKEAQTSYGIELDSNEIGWPAQIDDLRKQLGAPNEPMLFPPHFLKSTFPKIGGEVAILKYSDSSVGALFLFPRRKDSKRFTARIQLAPGGGKYIDKANIHQTLAWAGVDFELYDPRIGYAFNETHSSFNGFDIGRPSREEAESVRILQKSIWNATNDYLYPVDIHSDEFDIGTSLVVRGDEKVVGFLFGFYKREDTHLPEALEGKYRPDLKVESQLMGVLPEYRGKGVGFELKRQQGIKAKKEGIDIINWTVDPLQFPNAVLNFSKLGAIAFKYYPDYYQFRNELNQVAASRFGVTWIVSSPRVQGVLSSKEPVKSVILNPEKLTGVSFVNSGYEEVRLSKEPVEWLAIEVPSNWTELQSDGLEVATRWREATDEIFSYYLGEQGEGYAVTGVGIASGRSYLLARKLEEITGI